jgi:hypothetical protein
VANGELEFVILSWSSSTLDTIFVLEVLNPLDFVKFIFEFDGALALLITTSDPLPVAVKFVEPDLLFIAVLIAAAVVLLSE